MSSSWQSRNARNSLSSIGWRRGRGEDGRSARLPLSSVLAPLPRRGERKKKCAAKNGAVCEVFARWQFIASNGWRAENRPTHGELQSILFQPSIKGASAQAERF